MGFCLLTSSGSWNPSSYNISANTNLFIKVVGGGAGGSGGNWTSTQNGTAGGASSFGSLTAAGGVVNGGSQIDAKEGGPSYTNFSLGGISGMDSAGAGGDGWMPGHPFYSGGLTSVLLLPVYGSMVSSTSGTTVTVTYQNTLVPIKSNGLYTYAAREWSQNEGSNRTTANTSCYGRAGSMTSPSTASGRTGYSCGGVGYGAGGGGGRGGDSDGYTVGAGGGGGQIKDYNYLLTSTSAITVTVGVGGAGGSATGPGGGGAVGCVAIWW